jgi:hypothetical protein
MPKLYGKIIKGKEFMSFSFMNDQWSKYFQDEKKFATDIAKGLKPFDPKADIKAKNDQLIVVVSDKDAVCYRYDVARGSHPERYQDSEDITDFVKSDVGIKSLKDVMKILETLKK